MTASSQTAGRSVPSFSQRLWIVTGKGGTGKTTLTAALGLWAAAHGREALVVTTGDDDALPALLEVDPARARGREPLRVTPRLSLLCIEPQHALAEYLELQLHVGGLAGRLLRNRAFGLFLDAAPGWRELVTLGKIWHLEGQSSRGKPRFDLIVVDAPATGHGLSFLSVPRVVLDTVTVGPLRRQTESIQALLLDRTRTWCTPVTLAEELPVRETLELLSQLGALGIATGPLFLNRIEPPLELAMPEVSERLGALDPVGAPPLANPHVLLDALAFRARRFAQQERWIGSLREATQLPRVSVPYRIEPLVGRGALSRFAEGLAAPLASVLA